MPPSSMLYLAAIGVAVGWSFALGAVAYVLLGLDGWYFVLGFSVCGALGVLGIVRFVRVEQVASTVGRSAPKEGG